MNRLGPSAFSVSLFLVCVLVAALAAVLTWDIFTDRELDRANEARTSSLALADELRQSSNILGRMAMSYVLADDPIFKRNYRIIVAIRDGKLPRPNAGRVYWDRFVESASVSSNAAPGPTIALLDMLGGLGLTSEEAAKLREAKTQSDALNAIEVAAMQIMDHSSDRKLDQPHAFALLSNTAYRATKAAIMAPIEDFRVLVDARTQVVVDSAEQAAIAMRTAAIVITILLTAILVRTYWVLHRVMGGSIDHVHARIAALGHGDFSKPIVVPRKRHDSVMGWLADTQAKLAANREGHYHAMRRLQESESQFRQLAENIREVFFLANTTCTQFTYVSPGYEELWGQTCESLYADPASWHAAIHPEDRSKVQAAIAFESADGKFEYECRIIRPDGTLRWVRVRAFPIRGEHVHVGRIAGFAVDTTHRTQLEVVTRDDGRRFGSVVDHLAAPCFIANTQGRITYCNDAALALTGWSRVELLGRPCSEIVAPFAVGPIATASNDSGSWRMENRVMARGGSLAATTWRHIRLTSDEGVAEGMAMLAESPCSSSPSH